MSAYSVGNVSTVPTLSPNSWPGRVITRRSLCAMLLSNTCLVISDSRGSRVIVLQKEKGRCGTAAFFVSSPEDRPSGSSRFERLRAVSLELVAGSKAVAGTLVFQAPQLLVRTTVPAHVFARQVDG